MSANTISNYFLGVGQPASNYLWERMHQWTLHFSGHWSMVNQLPDVECKQTAEQ